MNLGGLAGLSATYPGYQGAVTTDLENQKNQAAALEAQNKLLAQHVLGRAIGGLPGSQPMAPPPGQASVPSQPAAPGGAQPSAPVTPGGAPAGTMPQMGEMDLKSLTARILQTSPGVQQRPEILMAALERAAPLLDRQGKEDLLEARKEMTTQRLTAASELAKERLKQAKEQHDAVAAAKLDHEKAVQTRFESKEARLAASAKIKEDTTYLRLDQQRQDLERKAQESGDKNALAAWRIVVNEQANRARAIINSNSVMSNLKDADRDALLADINKAHNEVIGAMREKIGTTTPTGGVTPLGQPVAPKVQGQVPQAAPPASASAPVAPAAPPAAAAPVQAPPAAMLKPNTVTTFANGQKWTLGPDGQPKQVP